MPIWSSTYLTSLYNAAEREISVAVEYLYHRFTLSVTQGLEVYTIPSYVRRIHKITWKGKKLEPLDSIDRRGAFQRNYFASLSSRASCPQSVPQFYSFNGSNYYEIIFYPTPSETVLADDTKVYDGVGIKDVVIVSCWRGADITNSNFMLPQYIARRLKKAYVLKEAFAKEGLGQNLDAAKYWEGKYTFLLDAFKSINSGVYAAKIHWLGGGLVPNGFTPARPVLPPNFPIR